MTQTARKGKLYQLQYQIDLSCFIVSRPPCIWLLQRFGSTKLIYFNNTSHKADGPHSNNEGHSPSYSFVTFPVKDFEFPYINAGDRRMFSVSW